MGGRRLAGRRDRFDDRNLGPVRSALELRLGLALVGLAASVAGLVVTTVVTAHLGWAVLFAVLVAITATNIAVLRVRFVQRRRSDESAGRGRDTDRGTDRKV